MVVAINLLPKENAVGKTTQKAVTILNKLALGITVFFLILAIAGGGTFFLMSRRLDDLKKEQDTITSNIESLQATEARFILLKDRIQKAQNILGTRASEEAFKKQQSVMANGTGTVEFEKSEIDSGRSELEIGAENSRDLASLVSSLLLQNNFTLLFIKELSFNQNTGFKVTFEVN